MENCAVLLQGFLKKFLFHFVSEINAKNKPLPLVLYDMLSGLYHIFAGDVCGIKICVLMQCFSLPMFCANVLHQDKGFDSRTSHAGNVALTIGIASST